MYYVVFPESEYTYTPHILSSFIMQNLAAAQNQTNQTNQITLLIQSANPTTSSFYYKDARWTDDYSKERLSRLIHPRARSNKMNIFEESEFESIRSVKFDQKEEANSTGLINSVSYIVQFKGKNEIRLNALIHEGETRSFLEHARQFAKKHDTEPLLFHDSIGHNWDSRFDNLARHLAETGYNTFLTFQPFRSKLLETPHFSNSNVLNSIGYFDHYKLS